MFSIPKSRSNGIIKLNSIPKKADKIYFIIDSNNRNCQIHYNNCNFCIILKNISYNIVPAISDGEDPMDCTITYICYILLLVSLFFYPILFVGCQSDILFLHYQYNQLLFD